MGSFSSFFTKIFETLKNFFDTKHFKHITFWGEKLFLPVREDDPLKRFKQIIFIQSSYLTILFFTVIGIYEFTLGLRISPLVSAGVIVINFLLMIYLKTGGKIYTLASIHIFLIWMVISFLVLESGGINSNMLVWYILVITMAFEYLDDRFGIGIWLLIVFISVVAIYFLTIRGHLFGGNHLPINYELILVLLFMFFYTLILFVYVSEKNLYQRQLLIKKSDLEARTQELMSTMEELQYQNQQIKFLNEKLEDKQMLIEHQVSVLKSLMKSRDEALNALATKNSVIQSYLQDLNDSLKYAEILQRMFLTDETVLGNYFSSYFIMHEQKQHVGGDFYFIKPVDEKRIFLVLGDATGHGPAGAILGTIAMQYLNDLFRTGLTKPAEILSALRDKVLTQFSHFTSRRNFYFGIEIAAVLFDKDEKTLWFAGLGRPIIIVKDKILLEFIPVNPSIMANQGQEPVNEIKIKLETADKVYMFSDGYYSQLNPQYKKYSKKAFKELLENIALQPLFTQKQILEFNLQEWRKDTELTDDLTILAVQV